MRKRFRPSVVPVALVAFALAGCGRAGGPATADTAALTTAAPAAALAGVRGDVAAQELSSAPAAAAVDAAAPPAAVRRGEPLRRVAADRANTAPPSLGGGADPAGAMLVRQGQASLEVRHVDDAVAKLRQASAQLGGFVANASLRAGRDEARAATLEVRVPAAQFDALVASLSGLGKVESVTASAQDVGDEYVDLSARVVNARRLEARLIEMLATRTGKLSDVLTMEQELARVREEIERYEGRIRWLERRTSLSTLAVSLHEALPLIERPNNGPIVEALGVAWERVVGVVAWGIAALGVVVPLALVAWAAARAARAVRRRRAASVA